ncbi:MAG: Coenzyme F420 hydrogenase/dehydrogenase, beta subunit C-terminal domain [Planctomycetia bacterium]|nr:Coenzyme F420 hydrogenase/dehydrogenase, beta subunit C-terminal domain [Planctomycetia bacterium]
MSIREDGDLAPRVDTPRCLEKCHLCLDACPFSGGVHNPRERNIELFRDQPGATYDENIGWHRRSIVGFRQDRSLREASASGGLATWCLEMLLEKGIVAHAAVVRLADHHENGFFEFRGASSVAELRQAAGSVYHPVEISAIVRQILAGGDGEPWAVVGVPCLCAAIRNSRRLRQRVPYVFGLACGMYQNRFYTEMLLATSGVDGSHVSAVQYRRKSDSGLASNFGFRGVDARGPGVEVPYRGLPYYLGRNGFFRLNACNFCMDVFAETADACFMDAWLPAYWREPKGTSLVVIRNSVIGEMFQEGSREERLWIGEISPEMAVASQRGHVRRKRELVYMRRRIGAPEHAADARPTMAERIDWLLQRRAQIRSKQAWAKVGRKYGPRAFWLAVADVVLMQCLARSVTWTLALPKRVARKCRKMLCHGT